MNGIKPDPDVKMDPDAGTPSGSGYMDDDFYEDTGELQLPPKGSQKDVWLTRIPDWLYDSIAKWDTLTEGNDNDEIDIGEVIAFPDETGQGVSKTQPMRIILNERWRQKAQLPNAFQLDVQPAADAVLGNTYVFTEKDLPGYRPNSLGQGKMGGGPGNYGGVQDPKSRVQKRSKYKKAIPKQTALVGHATRQYAATPLDTKEYLAFNAARIKQAIQGSNMRTNITEDDGTAEYDSVQKKFKTFIKPSTKPKAQLNKAARIAKNELIDLLHACFDEYKYWPMKALKARTKQPEAYLKEVLGDIAQLVRGGAFASNWMRLAMYNQNAVNQKEDAPPEELGAGESDGEEEMEDVV